MCWGSKKLVRSGLSVHRRYPYLVCDNNHWLLPLQDGNLRSHLPTMRSVVVRHFLIHTDSFLCKSNVAQSLPYWDWFCESVTFWYGSRSGSADPYLWLSDYRIRIQIRLRLRILLFSSVTFKTTTKNFFVVFYFLKLHLNHFSKIKSHNEVTKQKESRFFLIFLLDDRRIRIPSWMHTSN